VKTPQQIAEEIVGELTPAPAELRRKIAKVIQDERDKTKNLMIELVCIRNELRTLR
jgi:hypothetical protein